MNSKAIAVSLAAGLFAAAILCSASYVNDGLPDQVRWTFVMAIGVLCGAVSVKMLAEGISSSIISGCVAIACTTIGLLASGFLLAEVTGKSNWAGAALQAFDLMFVVLSGLVAFAIVLIKTKNLKKPLVDNYVAEPGEFQLQEMQLGAELKEKGAYLKTAAKDHGQTQVFRPRKQDISTSGIDADEQPPGMR